MRIAFFNPQGNFDPEDSYWTMHPDFGGQLVYVKEVAYELAQKGIIIDIFTRRIVDPDWPEFKERFDKYPDMDNINIIRIDFGGKSFLPKEELWPYLGEYAHGIEKYYDSINVMPDFVTTHYGDGGIAGVIFAKNTGIPFSFTAHSLGAQKMDKMASIYDSFEKMNSDYKFTSRITAERLAMKYSSVNIVSTSMERFQQYAHEMYKDWVDVKNDGKFAEISPGVNTQIFNSQTQKIDNKIKDKIQNTIKKYGTPERIGKPLIVASSRLEPKKNHIGLLKAYIASEELKEKTNLIIVLRSLTDPYEKYKEKPQPERKVLGQLIELIKKEKLQDRVFFLDITNQKELSSLYRVASEWQSVFAITTLYEPFGLAPIEAMACGLPVVATKNGGPSEILRDNGEKYGVLVDPQNIEDIKKGLESLLIDYENYESLQKKSVRRVREKYTWKITAEKYLTEIEKHKNDIPDIGQIPEYYITGENPPKEL
ncbi:MAG: glycosyltransferase [Thermotogota bacterium]|nr:glycosyltransferase [Thermotogota bacterium]